MLTQLLELTYFEMNVFVGAVVLGLLVSAFLGYRIGSRKDRPMLGAALGGLLVLPGLLVLSAIPQKEPEYY